MNILFKIVLAMLLLQSLKATNLKDIIDNTLTTNQNIKSKTLEEESAKQNLQSVKNIFNPSLNIGVNYQKLDKDLRNTQIGTTTIGYIKLGIDLYDGGKSIALKKQKNYEYKSSRFLKVNQVKSVILDVVTLYFNTKTIMQNIKIYQEKSKTLKAEFQRIQDKYNIQMATKDEVLKLKSEYESNNVTIEELKYQKQELIRTLSLISNIAIDELENALKNKYTLPEIDNLSYKESQNIQSLKMQLKAKEEEAKIVSAIDKPNIKIEDSLNYYDYSDYNSRLLTDLPKTQNQLMINLNYNLYNSSSRYKTKAIKLAQLSLKRKLEFLRHQEKIAFDLAYQKLQTQKSKIKALKSAVDMGNSLYEMVKLKYQNGLVDNITYLDALSKKIYNIARYKQALNDFEIAKARYYFASGIDYKKVLKQW